MGAAASFQESAALVQPEQLLNAKLHKELLEFVSELQRSGKKVGCMYVGYAVANLVY